MVFLPERLYFLRHAIAVDRDGALYKDDSLRPLTAPGQEKMRRAALGMRALGLKFDAIISSRYLRAKQTAEIVIGAYCHTSGLKNKKIHLTDKLLPPASIEELLQEIHANFPKAKNILLVGHQPHLTQMISSLLKSDPNGRGQASSLLDIDFKKGGLCHLTLDNTRATLNWLLTPEQLRLMGKTLN